MPGGGAMGEGGMGGGGVGGLLNGATVSPAAKKLLETKAGRNYAWAAAAIGSQNSASYQLATGKPVMAIGGFNGTDRVPDAGPVQEVRDGRQGPLLHLGRRHGWHGRRQLHHLHLLPDQLVGHGQLQEGDGEAEQAYDLTQPTSHWPPGPARRAVARSDPAPGHRPFRTPRSYALFVRPENCVVRSMGAVLRCTACRRLPQGPSRTSRKATPNAG